MSYSTDSAETTELLQQVAGGSKEAVDRLLELHRPYLKQLISFRIEPAMKARVDPSDIVQEAQAVIAKRLDDYIERRPASFRMWIRRNALERLSDERRKHVGAKKRSVYLERQVVDSSLAVARKLLTDTPSKVLRKTELQEQIQMVIEGLERNDREILTLRHAEGLSNSEAADLLGTSPNTIRQRYGRALRRLHEQLAANGISLDGEIG